MDLDDIKKGFARLLPLMEVAAKLTPNKYDDAAVAFIRTLLATDNAALRALVPKS